jgi:YebC/PmpR family DNA-binding regulatory protein
MAGHSKWAKVKHFKGALDAKRGKIFSKIAREITVAVKHGGGDPQFNPRLRTILLKARAANMPADNIERAIKKGTGDLGAEAYEEVVYEGFGPGGVALLVEVLTDNKNRTAGEIRSLFTKNNGNLGGAGTVKHLFQRKSHFIISKEKIAEDELLNLALEAGAEDMQTQDDSYEIFADPHQFEAVAKALEAKNIKPDSQAIEFLPISTVPISDEHTAQQVLKLVESLEDHDDVQAVHANFDIPDAIMEKAASAAAA